MGGDSFVISDPDTFARDILPTYFKHNNIRSFIRQLNTYGFRKRTNISSTDEHLEFFHEKFRRDQASLLTQIKRCHQPKPQMRSSGCDEVLTGVEMDKVSPDMDCIRTRVSELKSKLGALQSEIREYNSQMEHKVNMLMQLPGTTMASGHPSMQLQSQSLGQMQTGTHLLQQAQHQQHQQLQLDQKGSGQQPGQTSMPCHQMQPGTNGQGHNSAMAASIDLMNRRDALFASLGEQAGLSSGLSNVSSIAGLGLSGLGGGISSIGGVNGGLASGLMGSLGGLSGLTNGVSKSDEVAGLKHLLEAAQRYHTAEDSSKQADGSAPLAKRLRAEIGGQEEVATNS